MQDKAGLKREVLNLTDTQNMFFEDSSLIGIVCAYQPHKFCWLINNHFEIEFVRHPDESIKFFRKGNELYFPFFLHDNFVSRERHIMYALKYEKEPLLPEMRQFDFLWMVQSQNFDVDAGEIHRKLRQMKEISFANIFKIEQLINRNNLLI